MPILSSKLTQIHSASRTQIRLNSEVTRSQENFRDCRSFSRDAQVVTVRQTKRSMPRLQTHSFNSSTIQTTSTLTAMTRRQSRHMRNLHMLNCMLTNQSLEFIMFNSDTSKLKTAWSPLALTLNHLPTTLSRKTEMKGHGTQTQFKSSKCSCILMSCISREPCTPCGMQQVEWVVCLKYSSSQELSSWAVKLSWLETVSITSWSPTSSRLKVRAEV